MSPRSPEARAALAPLSLPAIALVWIPIALIGALHYFTAPDLVWVHNVARRLYYLPIVLGAFLLGLRGGLLASLLVSLTYLPHAFLHFEHLLHSDPGDTWDKSLEIVMYNAVATIAGVLADRERHRRAELERALATQRKLQEQLVRAGRLGALGEVVAGIAHEIKNPLHSLRGTAEVVDSLIPADAEERKLWELHVSELDRLARIAERFLSFSNPQPSALAELDLRDVATRLVELTRADAQQRGVSLELELPDELVLVWGDRDQLAQVALNITVNALRALGEQGGRIRVSVAAASSRDESARLCIENDGPPIPASEIDHVFDPFHSGHPDGTGLGLSISARIMGQHHGSLAVRNAGLGVSFILELPCH